uniref:PINc domain-containing protein n=1 Tax=Heterorhabditis bacteriophora TaxID=37862 RepID=A0A1I7XNU8_HETBA
MFMKFNTQLGPPFHVLIDTNFVNFAVKNRLDVMKGFMDCLYAKTTEVRPQGYCGSLNFHKCYIVATCDRDLKRRIRKIPGVPIMYILGHRFSIERMPDAYGAPQN